MNHAARMTRVAAAVAVCAIALTGCAGADNTAAPTQTQSATEAPSSGGAGGHEHMADGGSPPEGIEKATDPTYPVGTTVILTADHMPGMNGADATVSGAFDTTVYAVSYTPKDGGDRVTNHKWVVHEELENPGDPPLAKGSEVALTADHMPGMKGAKATIDSSTDETVYMVDLEIDGMTITNHKWVVESEIQPAS